MVDMPMWTFFFHYRHLQKGFILVMHSSNNNHYLVNEIWATMDDLVTTTNVLGDDYEVT